MLVLGTFLLLSRLKSRDFSKQSCQKISRKINFLHILCGHSEESIKVRLSLFSYKTSHKFDAENSSAFCRLTTKTSDSVVIM